MALLKVNSTSLTAVANAIRTAAGSNAQLTFPAGFVSAIGNLSGSGGTSIVLGVESISQTSSFTIGNLPFTPTNAMLMLVRRATTKGCLVSAVADSGYTTSAAFGSYTNNSTGYITNLGANCFTFTQNSAVFTAPSTCTINGVYLYAAWRS